MKCYLLFFLSLSLISVLICINRVSIVSTIVAYLKEVESPYEVHDFIRSYLGDTMEAKEFAKHFLERRAKQKQNLQQQVRILCLLCV